MTARGTETRQMQRALSIRVTPDDYAAIAEKAAGCGMPIARVRAPLQPRAPDAGPDRPPSRQ